MGAQPTKPRRERRTSPRSEGNFRSPASPCLWTIICVFPVQQSIATRAEPAAAGAMATQVTPVVVSSTRVSRLACAPKRLQRRHNATTQASGAPRRVQVSCLPAAGHRLPSRLPQQGSVGGSACFRTKERLHAVRVSVHVPLQSTGHLNRPSGECLCAGGAVCHACHPDSSSRAHPCAGLVPAAGRSARRCLKQTSRAGAIWGLASGSLPPPPALGTPALEDALCTHRTGSWMPCRQLVPLSLLSCCGCRPGQARQTRVPGEAGGTLLLSSGPDCAPRWHVRPLVRGPGAWHPMNRGQRSAGVTLLVHYQQYHETEVESVSRSEYNVSPCSHAGVCAGLLGGAARH